MLDRLTNREFGRVVIGLVVASLVMAWGLLLAIDSIYAEPAAVAAAADVDHGFTPQQTQVTLKRAAN